MDSTIAVRALQALGQDTRLAVFRMLVEHGSDGLAAGEIGDALGVLPNTLSANLNRLVDAALVTRWRDGRSIRYALDVDGTRALLGYLLRDCCRGSRRDCDPLLGTLFASGCCTPTRRRRG